MERDLAVRPAVGKRPPRRWVDEGMSDLLLRRQHVTQRRAVPFSERWMQSLMRELRILERLVSEPEILGPLLLGVPLEKKRFFLVSDFTG